MFFPDRPVLLLVSRSGYFVSCNVLCPFHGLVVFSSVVVGKHLVGVVPIHECLLCCVLLVPGCSANFVGGCDSDSALC
jgi:hypothetical protein